MKTTLLPLLGVVVAWAFHPALGEGEKYIKVDPATGKPEYISKDDAKKVVAMPDEEKLCEISFKPVKISKVVKVEGENQLKEVDGYNFDCHPSKDCQKTNKDANTEKEKIKARIEEQEKIINPPKTKENPNPKPPGRKEKEEAEKKLKKLKERLAKFKRECTIKYFVGAEGEDPGNKEQLPVDDLKKDKVENVVCTCQKIEIPGE